MIKDRGTIKWTAMMLPEHVQELKKAALDEERIKQPELDEQAIEEFELIICGAMESDETLVIDIFDNGFTNKLTGTVHFINHLKSQLILKDKLGYFHHVPFENLINIQPE
ncbi:YolD-like family protein [Cytobacillus sp. FJAT-53684]|uniref:YolD-like family protein n=1 Tax=Cytobacillus mangrovibacter TaxID=3299024 RepID=A0ABW6K3X2_9BACI